jgi:predicted DsbA family dithiol-disulfide isomerase
MSPQLRIDLWVDVVCPWCYLGKRRLETAIARFERPDAIDVVLRGFELDPTAPKTPVDVRSYLAKRMGLGPDQLREMDKQMTELATADGLPYSGNRVTANSLDVLRLVQLANRHGAASQFMSAVQTALFSGRQDAFDHDRLSETAVTLGVPADEVAAVVAGEQYADDVRQDQTEAIQLGATGVPFAVLGDRYGIPGAASVDGYEQAIRTAWDELHAAGQAS